MKRKMEVDEKLSAPLWDICTPTPPPWAQRPGWAVYRPWRALEQTASRKGELVKPASHHRLNKNAKDCVKKWETAI